AAQPKGQAAVILAQEQQPALRVRQLQRGVHQRGQDLVERRRAVQDLGHLEQQSQVLDLLAGPRSALRGLLKFLEQAWQHRILRHERNLVGVYHSQADLVAGFEHARRNALAVHESAVAALGVLKDVAPLVLDNARMTTRDAGVEKPQLVVALPPQGERRASDLELAVISRSVPDDQTWPPRSEELRVGEQG